MASSDKKQKNDKQDKKPKKAQPGKSSEGLNKTSIPREQDGQPGQGQAAGQQTLPQAVGQRQPDRGGKKGRK
jgi:hypothetical protein